MDSNHRRRVCVCYLITAGLISAVIYAILVTNFQTLKAMRKLKNDMEELSQAVDLSKPHPCGEPKNLNNVVDGMLQKRLSGIWDNIHSVKKQLKNNDCMTVAAKQDNSALDRGRADRVNYASEEFGAKIYHVEAKPVGGTNIIKSILHLDYSSNPPVNMLKPCLDPGSCFAFDDGVAAVTIKLAKQILIDSVEIAHITKELSPTFDVSSAPKIFCVFGVDDIGAETLLGHFKYDTSKQIEEYPVRATRKFKFVRFKFQENNGNPKYTCVYRVAVYGRM